jgi:hypothetical protein
MKKSLLLYLSFSLLLLATSWQYGYGQTYYDLSTGNYTQDWTNTTLITTNDNWSGVQSIIGYLGDGDAGSPTAVDPQTVLMPLTTIDVIANQSNPNTLTAGGVAEFEITDPVIAFQGSGTADYPNLIIFLNSTNRSNIRVQYDLRDVDGATDNAVQPVALQYRLGTAGNFTNVPAGYVADASTGPSLATMVTHVDVTLPTNCNSQPELQIRILTTNASGSDEWIGVDNIAISSIADVTAPIPTFDPTNGATDIIITATPIITFNEPVRKTDGNALENSDLGGLVTFRKTNSGGDPVPFSATIDATKKVITVTPTSSLENSQLYYLAMGAVEDASGNESTASNITFTTIAAATPTVTLTYPVGGETFYAGDAMNFTWTSANISNVKIQAWVISQSRTWDWYSVTESTPAATGSYNFTVPADLTYGTQYKIKISDASNSTVYSESGIFTCIPVLTSLTELRTRCIANDIVKLSSEATVTYIRTANRNQKFIQDAGAGLLIDDASAVLTTVLAVGDNIKNLEGKLGDFNGQFQIVPTKSSVVIASSGNTVTIPSMTLSEFLTNFNSIESMLVKVTNVTFVDANGTNTFAANTGYNITDGTNTAKFFTFKAGEVDDIIGKVIPSGTFNITGLVQEYTPSTPSTEISSRSWADLESVTVGIEKLSSDKDVKLYPVPSSSVLNISNVKNLRSIEILDATGKVVKTITTGTDELIQVPVDGLINGMYMIRFNTATGRMVKKFVKS